MKRQRIVHSYGEEDELAGTAELQALLEHCVKEGTVPHHMPTSTPDGRPENVDVVVSGRRCKCGSTTHQRTSHRECPLKTHKK